MERVGRRKLFRAGFSLGRCVLEGGFKQIYWVNMKAIFFRKTWPQMSSVSGYDPLYATIKNMPNIDALGFIAKTATSENLQSRAIHYFLRKLQRLNLALLSRPPHPMVDSSNEAIAKQIIRAATKNPASFIYLMAGETQLGT